MSTVEEMKEKMDKTIEAFRRELAKIRTGRASVDMFDGIKVESYGAMMPINQVATVTTPESRVIVIQPWDPQVLPSIEKAILKAKMAPDVAAMVRAMDFCNSFVMVLAVRAQVSWK